MKKIFFTAIFVRLICLYLFRNVTNYDLQSYLQVGELTLKGINIYPNVASLHHPYLPFFLYLEAMAVWLGQIFGLMRQIGAVLIIKALNITFDLGILYIVYLLSKKNLKTTFLYAINPVTILIATLHGQFDAIPIFFILLTIYLLKVKKESGAVLSYSFAILTKTWPILFLIPMAKKIKDKKLLLLIFVFPVLFSLIYIWEFKSSVLDIGKTLISYQGLWGIWPSFVPIIIGTTAGKGIVGLFWQKLSTLIFLISYFIYSYFNKEKNLINDILKLLIFFFVFTPNFSIQYLSWIIPFLILIKPKNYLSLIILISSYLFSFYYFWLFCVGCKITPHWLVVTQNIIGFMLWLSFVKVGYLSRK